MLSELTHWWKIIKTGILAIGVLLSFLAFVEVLHVYVILRDAYSPLGYAFLLLIAIGLIWFLAYILLNIRKRPKVLLPPSIENLGSASLKDWHTYGKYLMKYLRRLSSNPNLTHEDVTLATQKIAQLQNMVNSDRQAPVILEEIDKIEKETIEPLISRLDEKAEAEVRKCIRDIMLGVTVSPFRAADLVIVIYRNVNMVFRVMNIYYSRPLLAEQLMIFKDVFRAVATVNYMNYGERLLEKLSSYVPLIGQSLDDIAQGVGAGLLTSVAGHGAIHRCRAYRRWDEEIPVQTSFSLVRAFVSDLRDMAIRDVIPRIRRKIYAGAPAEETADPKFWEKTMNGITSAIDATGEMVETFVKKPVRTGKKETVKVSTTTISKSKKVLIRGKDAIRTATKSVTSGTGRRVSFVGKKLATVYKLKGRKGKNDDDGQ